MPKAHFTRAVRFTCEAYFTFRGSGTLRAKNPTFVYPTNVGFFVVREAGVEPARPEWTLEPESSESANSTTRASAVFRLLRYIITDSPACQADFSFLRLFFALFLPWNAALPRTPLHEPHISCKEGTDNEPVRSRIHAHSVDLDERINKIGSLLAKTADFGRGTRT